MSARSWVVSRIVTPLDRLSSARNSRIRGLGDEVQPDRGLIEVEDGRLVQERRREVAPHPLAQRQLSHRGIHERPEVEQFRRLVEVVAKAVRRHLVHVLEQLQRLGERQVPPELGALAEDHTDLLGELAALAPTACIRPPWLRHCDRHQDAGQHLDRGRFPGAVWADVAHDLAWRISNETPSTAVTSVPPRSTSPRIAPSMPRRWVGARTFWSGSARK